MTIACGRLRSLTDSKARRKVAGTPTPTTKKNVRDLKFFDLPGELRNRVYRHALHQPDGITIDSQNWLQPPMLLVCRQMREEAKSIFYKENDFSLHITGLKLTPQKEHWLWKGKINFQFEFSGQAVWKNLLGWLEMYYKGEVSGVASSPPDGDVSLVDETESYAGAFRMVDSVGKGLRQGCASPWKVMSRALDAYKNGVN